MQRLANSRIDGQLQNSILSINLSKFPIAA